MATAIDTAKDENTGMWQAKLEERLHAGARSATALMERVQREVPTDAIVRSDKVGFAWDTEHRPGAARGVCMTIPTVGEVRIHRHARGQIAQRAGIPAAYLETLSEGEAWQRQLAADILGRHFRDGLRSARHLVRMVGGEARGFMSDKFRRLDNRPLLDAFAGECQRLGAVPYDGTCTDTRVTLKAVMPKVIVVNVGGGRKEAMAFGGEWGNSDYGAARHSFRAFLIRLWCLNGATTEDALSQVHVGRQIPDDVELSARTIDLDTRTSVSALRDVVRGVFSGKRFEATVAAVEAAGERGVSVEQLKRSYGKRLLAGEVRSIEEAWRTDDVAILPPGDTAWRASNALSWIAKSAESADRRLELERLAGLALTGRDD